MNFDKIAILLKKINRVVDTLKDADIEVSSIEQELILSYIKELESAVLEGSANSLESNIRTSTPPAKSSVSPKQEAPISKETPKEELPKPEPVIHQEAVEKRSEIPAPVIKEKAEVVPVNAETKEESTPGPAEELLELFDIKQGTELSDILSFSPIKDLRKSMGVNERIFTINELFNGDQQLFDEVVQHLNGLKDFPAASDYLIKKVAVVNHWEAKDKKKKADHFVRLVYRRYL